MDYLRQSLLLRLFALLLVTFPPHNCPSAYAAPPQWDLVRTGASENHFTAIGLHPAEPSWIFAATQRALYESRDGGQTWQERFRTPAEVVIRSVAAGPGEQPTLLLATNHGLFGSFDGGEHWRRVFRASGEGEDDCTVVAFQPVPAGAAVLGTRGGLFASADGGHEWNRVALPPTAHDVLQLAVDAHDPGRLFVLSTQGLFVGSLASGRWEKRFQVFDAEEAEVEESQPSETGEGTDFLHHLSALVVDPMEAGTLYLATSSGAQMSRDDGLTWQRLPQAGLPSPVVSRLLILRHSPPAVYAGTGHGVARYEPGDERWQPLASGLAATAVNDLVASPTHLWAATAHGLYRLQIPPDGFAESERPSIQELLSNFSYEPSIGEVQQAAIRYAEVHPDKILRWRREAMLQALLPKVDLGLDRDRSHDVHVDEGTFPKFQLLQTKDRDSSLDLSVSWDLGELIWNDDQTSIDVRSKLMVQLRNDIVDEVTRTYFERRRLQVALLANPPADEQTLIEKELRLRELTALIDGLTGGAFSERVQSPNNPGED